MEKCLWTTVGQKYSYEEPLFNEGKNKKVKITKTPIKKKKKK